MSPWLRKGWPTTNSIAKPPATPQWDSGPENIATNSLSEAGSHLPNGSRRRGAPLIPYRNFFDFLWVRGKNWDEATASHLWDFEKLAIGQRITRMLAEGSESGP